MPTDSRFERSLFLVGFFVYCFGITLSQSLLSLGGSVFALLALLGFLQKIRKRNFTQNELYFWAASFLLVGYFLIGVLLRPVDRTFARSLGAIPLFLVPSGIFFCLERLSSKQKEKLNVQSRWALTLGLLTLLGITARQAFLLKVPATGFFNNPIYFAYALLPIFLFLVWDLQFSEFPDYPHSNVGAKITKFLFSSSGKVLLTGLTFFLIVLSQNRMVPVVAILATAYIIFLKLPKRPSLKLISAIAALVILSVFTLDQISPTFHEKFRRPINTQDLSYLWRLKAWSYNWNLFVDNPLFGVGHLKNGIDTSVQTELQGHWQPGVLIYAHSVYLQSLAEGGIFGTLFLFFWLLQLSKMNKGTAFLVCFGFLIAGITENITVNSKPFHAFLFVSGLMGLLNARQKPSGLQNKHL